MSVNKAAQRLDASSKEEEDLQCMPSLLTYVFLSGIELATVRSELSPVDLSVAPYNNLTRGSKLLRIAIRVANTETLPSQTATIGKTLVSVYV